MEKMLHPKYAALLTGQPPLRVVRIVKRRAVKFRRNAPCPCGSGKKFKLCCLK